MQAVQTNKTPQFVLSTEPIQSEILKDTRFAYNENYAGKSIIERAYVIVPRVDSAATEILFSRRDFSDRFPYFYQLPGGIIENEDSDFSKLKTLVHNQVGSVITNLQPFADKLWQLSDTNEQLVDCCSLYLADANPTSCGGRFGSHSSGLLWSSTKMLPNYDIINLDKNLSPSNSGRMGLMILAAFEYMKNFKASSES